MNFLRQVNHVLDEEHRATLDLMRRVEQACVRVSRSGGSGDPEFAAVAAAFAGHIERDIGRHFDFEERELFPRLEAAGEGDVVGLLMDEHLLIRKVAAEVLPGARAAAAGTLDAAGWEALKRGVLEMVERLFDHIEKETMVLLPLLEDHLDAETDGALVLHYASV